MKRKDQLLIVLAALIVGLPAKLAELDPNNTFAVARARLHLSAARPAQEPPSGSHARGSCDSEFLFDRSLLGHALPTYTIRKKTVK